LNRVVELQEYLNLLVADFGNVLHNSALARHCASPNHLRKSFGEAASCWYDLPTATKWIETLGFVNMKRRCGTVQRRQRRTRIAARKTEIMLILARVIVTPKPHDSTALTVEKCSVLRLIKL
jgi:hypothetical protein